MQIVTPSATLLHITPDAEQLIERCGRTCYKSEGNITCESAATFVRKIVEAGHHSVLEHASASILFVCDRGVSHELVRHRLASYSQESTRYCNYGTGRFGREISVIKPSGLAGQAETLWRETCEHAERAYLGLLKGTHGVSPEWARSVLPTCLKTEIATTANLREWRHILALRTDKAAHPQIREVMWMAAAMLAAECPSVFHDVAPPPRVGEDRSVEEDAEAAGV